MEIGLSGAGRAGTNANPYAAGMKSAAYAEMQTISASYSDVIVDIRSRPASADADSDDKDDKKKFKSVKELVAYLTMLMARWLQEKPQAGHHVKMEDRKDYEKLRKALQDAMSDSTVVF
jgi:hypothetical protein